MQAADDALMAIMRKLHTYRGDSRFTTWAYKFALLEAAVKVRKRAWHGREVPLEADGWAQLADRGAAPDADAESAELIAAVCDGIAVALTPHQRTVLVALALNDVPIDVLADRLGTTRGALYKTLHDARQKLRARLSQDGLASNPQRKEDAREPTRPLANRRPAGPPARARRPGAVLRGVLRAARPLRRAGARRPRRRRGVPGMRPHLEGCPACREDHDSLAALLAAQSRPPR